MWNEIFGWFLILAGVLMGSYMGIKFQREDWLGGWLLFPSPADGTPGPCRAGGARNAQHSVRPEPGKFEAEPTA